jgi:adenylosuccinate synthase
VDSLAEIKVGVSYRSKGKKINYFPSNTAELGSVEVHVLICVRAVHVWSSVGSSVAAFVNRWSTSHSLASRPI